MKSKPKGHCETHECPRDAKVAGLCAPCYGRLHYAMKQGPKWAMDRQRQVRVWINTLDVLRPGNVVQMRKRA